MPDSVRWYQKNAPQVAERYESIAAEDVHDWLIRFLPENPGRILDIGAGSGRDAAWLAGLGHQVVAVEPSLAMRKEARLRHSKAAVQWINDRLPSLSKVSRKEPFDLILISGVWMYVAESDRKRAFRKAINLLKPGGVLAIMLRHGPQDPERGLREVSVEELEDLARAHGALVVSRTDDSEDCLGRGEVRWSQVAIRFPDDGTGMLPLLRYVILNQSKSATHKLGLLRTLCRIADSAPGIARSNGDKSVSVPMGLVALVWLRLYKPLLKHRFPQLPARDSRLAFVKDAYRKIEPLSPLDLRVGRCFSGEEGLALHQALKDAADNIKRMPIKHMKYSGADGKPILQAQPGARARRPQEIRLDEAYLFSFGEVRIPEDLWQALRKHSVWVEPVVISEWAKMMRDYAQSQKRKINEEQLRVAMAWDDPKRDVQIPRKQAMRLMQGHTLHCVWSGKRLREASLHIDHCLPWSVWSCGDLWNLMPAKHQVNLKKKDCLPSETVMEEAQERILDWWDRAYYRGDPFLQEMFLVEAAASLPGVQVGPTSGLPDLEEIFNSLCLQRTKLRRDQQAPEWEGMATERP